MDNATEFHVEQDDDFDPDAIVEAIVREEEIDEDLLSEHLRKQAD